MMTRSRTRVVLVLCTLVMSMAMQSAGLCQQADFDWASARDLYPGIKHASLILSSPRPMKINALRIDTTTPGLRFYTTPRQEPWVENQTETTRQSTRDFLRTSRNTDRKLAVAINADAFSPWPAPWDKETSTNLLGLAVSEGVKVSPGGGTASFMVSKDGSVSMAQTTVDNDVANIRTAVSGFGFCLKDGNPVVEGADLHPRTGIGLSRDSRYVIFLTIDGRRPSSQGATTREVGSWLKHFGACTGINMDGGGSTTMAWWNPGSNGSDKCKLLNSPCGNGANAMWMTAESEPSLFKPTERRNGNNIGVYYCPALGFSRTRK